MTLKYIYKNSFLVSFLFCFFYRTLQLNVPIICIRVAHTSRESTLLIPRLSIANLHLLHLWRVTRFLGLSGTKRTISKQCLFVCMDSDCKKTTKKKTTKIFWNYCNPSGELTWHDNIKVHLLVLSPAQYLSQNAVILQAFVYHKKTAMTFLSVKLISSQETSIYYEIQDWWALQKHHIFMAILSHFHSYVKREL